ncbi:Na+/H+ antiporter NhaC family protein [Thermococcus zilligii]|uniref:Na+/H+ antiporter NhaC family protein n=1 Tax=Thermococcus zilligii TaxID=54076 RepID=UPI00029B0758|nr:Na+/H+ antiporter NhaC family protein [Thermococcus zilligii]
MSDFGVLSLLPPLVAIILAVWTKRVLFALFAGVWIGGVMASGWDIVGGTIQTWSWVVGNVTDSWNATILVFDLLIGAGVGLIYKSGGVHAVARVLSRRVKSSRGSSVLGWLMGVLVFFDDYTNTIIVGNTMRPITDRTRVSREMLAYIDDSTAAPVAGIALVSTWIGYELGLIKGAFVDLGVSTGEYYAWLHSVPYTFYSILAIILVFIVAYTHRHFGAMLHAEYRARTTGKVLRDGAKPLMTTEVDLGQPKEGGSVWNFVLPIAMLVLITLGGMWHTGSNAYRDGFISDNQDILNVIGLSDSSDSIMEKLMAGQSVTLDDVTIIPYNDSVKQFFYVDSDSAMKTYNESVKKVLNAAGILGEEKRKEIMDQLTSGKPYHLGKLTLEGYKPPSAMDILSNSDAATALLWGSFMMVLTALILIALQRQMTFEEIESAIVQGMKQMMFATAILVLAWSIKSATSAVGTAEYVVGLAKSSGLSGGWVPLIVFLAAMFISFTTGTSWGTFGIMMPIAIPLAYSVTGNVGPEVFASIGAVFAGGIFGDHCSPISDTTIMSSMFSGSDHIDHVKTQIPYAVTAAGVSFVLYVLFGIGVRNWAILLPLGIVLLVAAWYFLSEWYGKKYGIPHGKVPVYTVEE